MYSGDWVDLCHERVAGLDDVMFDGGLLKWVRWGALLAAVAARGAIGSEGESSTGGAYTPEDPASLQSDASDGPPIAAATPPGDDTSSSLGLKNTAIILGGSLLVGYYGMNQWWEDGFAGRFRTRKEGWFAPETDSGGADKLGHSYFSYATARLMARAFEAAGNTPERARRLGVWSALGVMMGVEIVDGYSKKYRFSGEDAAMNLAGAGLAYALETYPALDRLLDYRLLYKPSPGSSFEPGGDYSGQTYLLVLKANGLEAWREHPVMRYVEFAVGYGTRGYGESPPADAHRVGYVGLSLNLSELLARTVFRGHAPQGRLQQASEVFLELVQVPGMIVTKGRRF